MRKETISEEKVEMCWQGREDKAGGRRNEGKRRKKGW